MGPDSAAAALRGGRRHARTPVLPGHAGPEHSGALHRPVLAGQLLRLQVRRPNLRPAAHRTPAPDTGGRCVSRPLTGVPICCPGQRCCSSRGSCEAIGFQWHDPPAPPPGMDVCFEMTGSCTQPCSILNPGSCDAQVISAKPPALRPKTPTVGPWLLRLSQRFQPRFVVLPWGFLWRGAACGFAWPARHPGRVRGHRAHLERAVGQVRRCCCPRLQLWTRDQLLLVGWSWCP